MRTKPWNEQTFPKDRVIYLKRKGMYGASIVFAINYEGINVLSLSTDGKKIAPIGISWKEVHTTCIQWDGTACGEKA